MEINILIVDDDKILVDKLEETVSWKEIGISMVFTANNIRQAKNILNEFPIQIILCDIDMPQGNGLELLEWVRDNGFQTECVFLSSYANFGYVQKALRLSSREYLLKPISNRDLEHSLSKITKLINEKNTAPNLNNIILEKNKVWNKFVEENISIEKIYKKDDNFILGIFKLFMKENIDDYRKKLHLCRYILNNCKFEAVIQITDNKFMFVIKSDIIFENIDNKLNEIISLVKNLIGCDVCIYLTENCSVKNISDKWQRIKDLEYTVVPKRDGIIKDSQEILNEYEKPDWDLWKKR